MKMKKIFQILIVATIVVVLPATLVFSGKGSAKKVTITLMRDAAEMPDEVIQTFEQQNEGINVSVVENDPAKLMAMIAGGNAPDVFRINGIGSPYWIRKGLLMDITSNLEKSIDMDDLFPVNGMFRFDGTTQGKGPYYGIVKDWSLDYMYYYNKDALKEAGVPVPSDD